MRKIFATDEELAIIQAILAKYVPEYEVWAFGSRVTGKVKPYSDLDLAIITDKPLSLARHAELVEAFSESDLTWKVDIMDWALTSENFREIIKKNYCILNTGNHMKLLDLSESQNCRIVLKECYEIFLSEFFVDDISISCQLHQKLKNESLHIASACNLAGSIEDVREFIDSLNINDENNDKITFIHIRLYLTLLFYIFEQAKSFYDKIKNEKTSFEQMFGIKKYEKDGNNLELLKCYVNFSKHPKDIVHSHHPTFFVENEYGKENSEQKFIFDRDQFFKFYLRKLHNNEREILFKTIAQKQNIKIVFEDLKDVTREFSLSIKEFLTYCSDDGIFQKIEKELSIELL